MASSVLGKRTRSSGEASAIPELEGRRIRRRPSRFTIVDENEDEDPFTESPASSKRVTRQNITSSSSPMEVDSDNEDVTATPSRRKTRRVIQQTKRIPLSPTKINQHFRVSKPVAETCENKVAQIQTQSENQIPQTPRHRDSKLKQAVTPKHRVTVPGFPLTPRTPRTPGTSGTGLQTIYAGARQIFARGTQAAELVGREDERKELREFLAGCVDSGKGGSIYVSGPPGTGKSATVNDILKRSVVGVKQCVVNCMAMKTAQDVYSTILAELELGTDAKDAESHLNQLMISGKAGMIVVVLDEIDNLLLLDADVLCNLFQMALQPTSTLVLVGIANALDLTDRFLPQLKAKSLKPHLLPFMPYTAPQIATIITERLRSLLPADSPDKSYIPFVHPAAVQFCAKKVASQTGDLRKAFDICRRAIDIIEMETKSKLASECQPSPVSGRVVLGENANLSTPPSCEKFGNKQAIGGMKTPQRTLSQAFAALKPESAPRATIAHLARVTSAAFGNGVTERLRNLNLQQKATMCALLALEKRARDGISSGMAANQMMTPSRANAISAPTVKSLYELYSRLCERDNVLHPLTITDFRDVLSSLDVASLLCFVDDKGSLLSSTSSTSFMSRAGSGTPSKRGKASWMGSAAQDDRRVASRVAVTELESAIEGTSASILKSLLKGEDLF